MMDVKKIRKPELLAPAGTLEKLKVALNYGADAVYFGAKLLSLRKSASNFTLKEMRLGAEYAHKKNKKVYLALNISAFDDDLKELKNFLNLLKKLQPDGIIVSDAGVFGILKKETGVLLHISTQASVTNRFGCEFWKKNGASRIILARELSLDEIKTIKENVDIELEVFIHGAMCVSYSGKCVISNYLAGRDANSGGCVQNCRFPYNLYDFDKKIIQKSIHFMSSKDLMAIRVLPELINLNVDSLKIEGRMKSNMYVANTVSVYRDAIDTIYDLRKNSTNQNIDFSSWENKLSKVSNRTFTKGSLKSRAFKDSVRPFKSDYVKGVEYIGLIKEVLNKSKIALQVKSSFIKGENLEMLDYDSKVKSFVVEKISNINGEEIHKALPSSVVILSWVEGAKEGFVLRRPIKKQEEVLKNA